MRLLIGLLITLTCASAFAQDFDKAEKHFSGAQSAFARKDFKTSAAEFQSAYDITHDPIILYNVGEAWQKGGEGRKAVAAFKQYLRLQPNAADKKDVLAHIKEIESKNYKIADTSVAAAAVTVAAPPPPTVPVVPTTPVVPPPPAPVVVTPPPPPPPVVETPPAPPPPPSLPETLPPPEPEPAPTAAVAEPRTSNLRVGAWVAVAGTVALVTTGAIFALAAQSRADEISRRFNYVDPATNQPKVFDSAAQSDYKNLKDDGNLYRGLSIGFFAASGVCAITSTALFIVDANRARKFAAVHVSPSFAPGQAGVSAGWSF